MSLYRLDIAPLTPLPLTRSPFFSYRHEKPLPLGTLVQIPFGKRSLKGIIYACALLPGRAPLWLKPIEKVIREGWLTDEERLLAEKISETYVSSLGNTLKHFIFPLPVKNLFPFVASPPSKKPRRKKVIEMGLIFAQDETLWENLEEVLSKNLKRKEATLVLVPDLFLLATLEQKLKSVFSDKLLTLSSKLTPKQMEMSWNLIRTGEAKILLGTRQALFAPFRDLRHVVVLFPEERLSYKQWDMTPYYEALFGARTVATLFQASLTFFTVSPGLVAFPKATQKFWKKPKASHTPPLFLVDRRKDGKGARAKVLAKEIEKVIKTLPKEARILFIAKERGVSGILICQHCRTTARCPSCEHTLAENQEGVLRCLHCNYESSFFPKCAKCSHMHFKSFGVGTVRLERELERAFPPQTILRIDRDSLGNVKDFKKRVEELSQATARWIISTPEIGSLLQLPKQDLIVMLEADHTLAFPDFEGEERLALEVKRFQAKLQTKGILAVQTFAPEERVWQWLSTHQEEVLWETLFQERESFGYPPVTAIIKVSPLLGQERVAEKDFSSIRERFKETLTQEELFEVTPLYTPKKKWGRVLPSFLIKYPLGIALPPSLITLLRRESAHLKIDIHPLRLH